MIVKKCKIKFIFSIYNNFFFLFKENIIIIFGSEGNGISNSVLDICDYFLYIEDHNKNNFPYCLVDSLNVGVSTGIILNHFKNNLKIGK